MLRCSAMDLVNILPATVYFFPFFLGLPNEGVPLTFCMWDESYSTSDARRMIKTSSTKLSTVIKNKDAVAASVILKSFLRSFHNVWVYLQEYFIWHALSSCTVMSWCNRPHLDLTWLELFLHDVTWPDLIWRDLVCLDLTWPESANLTQSFPVCFNLCPLAPMRPATLYHILCRVILIFIGTLSSAHDLNDYCRLDISATLVL